MFSPVALSLRGRVLGGHPAAAGRVPGSRNGANLFLGGISLGASDQSESGGRPSQERKFWPKCGQPRGPGGAKSTGRGLPTGETPILHSDCQQQPPVWAWGSLPFFLHARGRGGAGSVPAAHRVHLPAPQPLPPGSPNSRGHCTVLRPLLFLRHPSRGGGPGTWAGWPLPLQSWGMSGGPWEHSPDPLGSRWLVDGEAEGEMEPRVGGTAHMPYVTSELTAAPARRDGRGVGGGPPEGGGGPGPTVEGAAASPGAQGRWASAQGLLWLEGAGRGGEGASPGHCGSAWGAGRGQICLLPHEPDVSRVLTSEQGLF